MSYQNNFLCFTLSLSSLWLLKNIESSLLKELRYSGFFFPKFFTIIYFLYLPVKSLSLWLPGDLADPGIGPRSPTLQADSLLSEPPEKPMSTGVGSLPFTRESSWPRNWTGVSCLAGIFFTSWAIREALELVYMIHIFSLNYFPPTVRTFLAFILTDHS